MKLTTRASERNYAPLAAYDNQRRKAARRGLGFHLTFAEWQWLWWQSGKWEERGNKAHQYVMARYKDQGPYAVGNVFFQTVAENAREGNLGRKRGTPNWKMCNVTGRRVYNIDWRHMRSCPSCSGK